MTLHSIKEVFAKSNPDVVGFILKSEFDIITNKISVMIQWPTQADWQDPNDLEFVDPLPMVGLCLCKHPTENLYLGVSRKNNLNDFGLPGGKKEKSDATIARTALRELLEESGYVGKIQRHILTQFDGNFSCAVFEISNLIKVSETTESGIVKWLSEEELCSSFFAEFNKEVFAKIKK